MEKFQKHEIKDASVIGRAVEKSDYVIEVLEKEV